MNLLINRYNNEDNLYLENLSKLVGSGFKQHYLILLAAKEFKNKWFNHFVKQLETVLFFYTLTKEAPRDIEKRFASWTVIPTFIISDRGEKNRSCFDCLN